MAIGAATPDHARVRRDVRSGERVVGRYVTTVAYSEPFRCRYTPAQESESRSQGGVRRTKPATVMVSRAALAARGLAGLRASDRLEVTPLGGQPVLMEVQGEPKPIRKRRTTIGWTAQVQRVSDSEAANVVAP